MITRRSVRVKCMQQIYSYELLDEQNINQYREKLLKNTYIVYEQYLFILNYIKYIANYTEEAAKKKAAKYIKSEEDKNFSTKILSNILVQYLNNDKVFIEQSKKYNIDRYINDDLVFDMYNQFVASSAYKDYVNDASEFNLEQDKKIINYLYEDILLSSEQFIHAVEENFINWTDDALLVVDAIKEVIVKSNDHLKLHFGNKKVKEKLEEIANFGAELFTKTIEHKAAHLQLIEPKLKNWDTERLATLDVILLRMALSEFMYFPSIPIKVTINEYLDIAKEYSTPKSKNFINGVLDNLMREMKENQLIKKTGRGLL
ncbi:MAG: transcription antitermination factor NusB [Chitinophagales bacterium]|nr:transcription antitermination factor NusB [Chitinophagales bacterium]